MAIRKEKYVDITSKLGGASVAARRSLTARVFTQSPVLGYHQIAQFNDATEVMDFFGAGSREYKFAVKYFGFVSKSVTRAEMISYAGWGGANSEAETTYRKFDVEINDATLNGGGVVCTSEDGDKARYNTIHDALTAIGDEAIVNVTLNTDIIYFTASTPATIKEHIKTATGISSFTTIASNTNKLVNGLVVGTKQIVNFDLNGHIFAGYNTCFVNLGILNLFDSIGTGRAFTTNVENTLVTTSNAGVVGSTLLTHTYHSNASNATCEVVRNFGRLSIASGWYGTPKCVVSPFVNETTWGNAIGCQSGSVTKITGGYFTAITHNLCAAKLAADLGVTQGITSYGASGNKPFASVFEVYENAYLAIEGGTVFGLYSDAILIEDFSNSSLSPAFGVVEITGGAFYGGFTSGTFYPSSSSKYNRYSLIRTGEANKLPNAVSANTRSYCVITGGAFYDNCSPTDENGANAMTDANLPNNANYPKSHFSGRVHLDGGTTNFTYDAAFDDKQYAVDYLPYSSAVKGETALEAVSRVDALDDNFGSFCFMEALTPDEAREVAEWNAAKNFKYLYSLPVKVSNCKQILETVRDMSGTCYTLDKFDAFAEYMPMALFAATKYDRVNATKVFMYQQFDGERASVTTSQDADKYDAFDIDGQGTRFPVNYYGATQQAGSLINFYQDGYNADGLDTACYCNEIWLKDAISVELLNTFIALEKIPANNVGKAIVRNAIISVLHEGIRNETITVGKTLDNLQRAYVDRTAGLANAWENVESYGYWLTVDVKHRTLKGGRVQYYADYVLMYAKGDAIRKVEGSDILI